MPVPDECGEAHRALLELALRDPKQARLRVCELLDSDAPYLEELLRRLSLPGEGRLRHLVANAVRTRPDKAKVAPYLVKWLETETDEFAKRAITAALHGVDRSAFQKPNREGIADPGLVAGYRNASARLAHKLRNALEAPHAQILRLRSRVEGAIEPALRAEMLELLARLQDGFNRVGRVVEFDPDEEWFRIRPIDLDDWLRSMNARYAKEFRSIVLEIVPSSLADRVRVRGSDHLLDAIFWNLWQNSQQAAGENCRITVQVEQQDGRVILTLVDNGNGFEPPAADAAFRERFSTRGSRRGRGLLEVQAAVDDLQGSAIVARLPAGDYRVVLSFPLEPT